MTTVARRDPADKAKIDAIEKKLLANPEIAKLIDDLGTSTTDGPDPLVVDTLKPACRWGSEVPFHHATQDLHRAVQA